MKVLSILIMGLLLTSCATKKQKQMTAKEQVVGLQKSCMDATPAIKKRQAENSLYNRLGKKKKIRELVETIYVAHKKNPEIGHMMKKVRKEPFIENVTMFLVVGSGGKGKYKGRGMKAAHRHLHVTNADFLSAGADVQNSMKKMNYGDNEIQEVVCALVHFIPEVVVN